MVLAWFSNKKCVHALCYAYCGPLFYNWEYLEHYFAEKGVSLSAVDPLLPQFSDLSADRPSIQQNYNSLIKDVSYIKWTQFHHWPFQSVVFCPATDVPMDHR